MDEFNSIYLQKVQDYDILIKSGERKVEGCLFGMENLPSDQQAWEQFWETISDYRNWINLQD